LQRDAEGIDGDAESANRLAVDYRDLRPDHELIHGALAAALGGHTSAPPRRALLSPDGIDALVAWIDGLRRGTFRLARQRLGAWRRAAAPVRRRDSRPFPLPPKPPFVAVLLQAADDPRTRLDVDSAVDLPNPEELVRRVAEAARAHDPELGVHVVPPHARVEGRAAAAATAAAVVTVNDPLGLVGILAGTPVVHLGRTRYGIPGVARRADPNTLADELALALGVEQPTLRLRFATRVLREDLLWCDPHGPDQNGLAGLVADFEARLSEAITPPPPVVYRPEPPLP
jgi:hypothetical protein